MMLTQNEKKWLKARKLQKAKHLLYHRNEYFVWSGYHFAKDEIIDLQDALEFSERVAAKLAITGDAWDFEDMPCRGERQYMRSKCPLRKNHWDCADCYIKAARLQVEEEMDNG